MDYSDLFDVSKDNKGNLDLSNLSVNTHVVEHESVVPSYQGDYAKAIFLWGHSKGSREIGVDSFAGYIKFECGIADPVDFQRKMISEGYLEEDSMAIALESLSGEQLKAIATEVGVATSGKKIKVVERILGAADMDYLYTVSPKTCSITDKGKAFVKEHDDCVQIHRHKTFGIEWKEYEAIKRKNPNLGFSEIAERILIQRASEDERFLGSAQYLFLSELLYEYDRPQKATMYLLQRMYLGVNGVTKWWWIRDYVEKGYGSKKLLLENFYFGEFFNSNDAEKLRLHGEFYSTDVVDKLYTWKLPIQLCDKVLFEQMLEAVLDECFEKERFEPILRERYTKYVEALKGKYE